MACRYRQSHKIAYFSFCMEFKAKGKFCRTQVHIVRQKSQTAALGENQSQKIRPMLFVNRFSKVKRLQLSSVRIFLSFIQK